MSYDLKVAPAPRLTGAALRAAALALENPISAGVLGRKMLADLGVLTLRRADLPEPPSAGPRLPRVGELASETRPIHLPSLVGHAKPASGFAFETVSDFGRAYREGSASPVSVAEKWLAHVAELEGGKEPASIVLEHDADLILEAARESRARFEKGCPKGPLDGVPITVKDEFDVAGLHTRVGTRFLKNRPLRDATAVARLRAAGAILVGKVNMYEIGIDPSGFNPHYGTPINPYAPGHYPGGSSSGSAASVAAGLCPLSVGADGGGSIRIPASLCGVVGLKATWSRISEHGAFPLCASVGHTGPLGATVRDVALAYAVMAGPDPDDRSTLGQPAAHLDEFGERDLSDVTLGIYRPWFEDAEADVVQRAEAALEALRTQGARVKMVEIPGLDLARIAQAVTILCEMAACMERYDPECRKFQALGARINLAIGRALTGRDYVQAQRARTRLTNQLAQVFSEVDLLLSPTTGITAPPILPDVLPHGESNLRVTSALMRYAFPANLAGNPAISVPFGVGNSGRPVGVQLMGRPWEEHLLFRVAEVLEGLAPRLSPKVHRRLLG